MRKAVSPHSWHEKRASLTVLGATMWQRERMRDWWVGPPQAYFPGCSLGIPHHLVGPQFPWV